MCSTLYKETEIKPLGKAFSPGSLKDSALSTQKLNTLKARAAGTLKQKQQLFYCTNGNSAQCPVSLQTKGLPCNQSCQQPRFLNSVWLHSAWLTGNFRNTFQWGDLDFTVGTQTKSKACLCMVSSTNGVLLSEDPEFSTFLMNLLLYV